MWDGSDRQAGRHHLPRRFPRPRCLQSVLQQPDLAGLGADQLHRLTYSFGSVTGRNPR